MDILYETEDDRLTIKEQIKTACIHANMTLTELAEQMGMSQQSLTNRLKTGKFTKEELEKIAAIMGCKYRSYFEFSDGFKI